MPHCEELEQDLYDARIDCAERFDSVGREAVIGVQPTLAKEPPSDGDAVAIAGSRGGKETVVLTRPARDAEKHAIEMSVLALASSGIVRRSTESPHHAKLLKLLNRSCPSAPLRYSTRRESTLCPERGERGGVGEALEKTTRSRLDHNNLHDQFTCHWQVVRFRAPNKPSWNLDSKRPDVGLAKTIAASCNPGGGKED